jgi:hypothetical protein
MWGERQRRRPWGGIIHRICSPLLLVGVSHPLSQDQSANPVVARGCGSCRNASPQPRVARSRPSGREHAREFIRRTTDLVPLSQPAAGTVPLSTARKDYGSVPSSLASGPCSAHWILAAEAERGEGQVGRRPRWREARAQRTGLHDDWQGAAGASLSPSTRQAVGPRGTSPAPSPPLGGGQRGAQLRPSPTLQRQRMDLPAILGLSLLFHRRGEPRRPRAAAVTSLLPWRSRWKKHRTRTGPFRRYGCGPDVGMGGWVYVGWVRKIIRFSQRHSPNCNFYGCFTFFVITQPYGWVWCEG